MSGAQAPKSSDDRTSVKTVVRLKTRPQFLFVRAGTSYRTKSIVVQARKRRHGGAGTSKASLDAYIGEGFTATKKIGNAVIRNRAKRRLRAASASLLPEHGLSGIDYVFIARQQTGSVQWRRLLDDMEKALLSLANTLDDTANAQN